MGEQVATQRNPTGRSAQIRAPQFTGRERELAALAEAIHGPAAVVLVEGEAGIGKTRLIREFLAAAQEGRAMVACCPPLRTPLTLAPLVDAIRQATGSVAGLALTGLAGALRPLFPEWAQDLPPAPEPAGDATAARHRIFRALAELLHRLGVTVLVVEDAHWADEATIELLLFLASRQPRPLSMVVTVRPEDVPDTSLLSRLSRQAAEGLRLALRPLDVAEAASLVSSMLDGKPVSETFAGLLYAHTGGLPLALEESVRLLHDRADLRRFDGEWLRHRLGEIAVPPTVRDTVLERTGRMSVDARRILQAAAVFAEPVPEPVLAGVARLTASRAREGLCEALRRGILAEDIPKGQVLVSFRHVLVARAMYEATPAPERRELHRRAGHALEQVVPLPLAALAHHFREAGDSGHWSGWAEQAADAALAAGDHHTAAALLHDLVVHAGLPPGEVVRLACKVPMMALSGYASVAGITQSMLSVLGSAGLSARHQAEARWRLGYILIANEDYEAGAAELVQAIPGLAHRPVEAAHAMTLLGWPLHGLWPAAKHRRWLDRAAAAVSDPAVSASDRQRILGDRTTALLMMGDDEGWADVAELPQDAADPQEALSLAVDWMNAGEAAMYWGRYAQARQSLAVGLRLASHYQYPRVRENVQTLLAHLDWFTGAWDGPAGRAEALLADPTDAEPLARMEAMLTAGLLAAAAGAPGPAEQRLRLVLEEQARRGSAGYVQEPAAALARRRLAHGHIEDALALTDDPVGVVMAKGIWIWATDITPVRVQALCAAGRAGEAADLAAAFARGLRGRDAPAPRASLATCRAILAEARGEHGRAAALFARAAAAWAALPRPYDALLAGERQARCLVTAGRGDAGLARLAEVMRGLSELGASGDAARVARSLRQHGRKTHRPGAGRPRYGNQLSPRELAVLRLVVTGQTNQQIADALFLSPKTVACHIGSAKRKLLVTSRAALAVKAVEAGVMAAEEPAAVTR